MNASCEVIKEGSASVHLYKTDDGEIICQECAGPDNTHFTLIDGWLYWEPKIVGVEINDSGDCFFCTGCGEEITEDFSPESV